MFPEREPHLVQVNRAELTEISAMAVHMEDQACLQLLTDVYCVAGFMLFPPVKTIKERKTLVNVIMKTIQDLCSKYIYLSVIAYDW